MISALSMDLIAPQLSTNFIFIVLQDVLRYNTRTSALKQQREQRLTTGSWVSRPWQVSYWGGGSPVHFDPFLLPFLSFSLSFFHLEMVLQILQRDLWSAISSPSGGKTTSVATRHVLLALNTSTPKMRLRPVSNAFFVYLEPRERVWWLQMSSYFY